MIPGIDQALVPDLKIVLDRTKDKLMDRLTARQYQLVSKAIDKVSALLDEPTPQQQYDLAMDARVNEILSGEPFKSQRLKMEADRELFQQAKKYMDFIAHTWWETLPDWFRPTVTEPSIGCSQCRDAYIQYMSHAHKEPLETAYDELENNTASLDQAFSNYMEELRHEKPIPALVLCSGNGTGPEEEPI